MVPLAAMACIVLGTRDVDASHAGADDFGSDNRAVLDHRGQGVHSGRDDPFHGHQRSRARVAWVMTCCRAIWAILAREARPSRPG